VVDDLEIDIPQARQNLAMFLARAIVDELLPPSFLQVRPFSPPFLLPAGAVRCACRHRRPFLRRRLLVR
jgi:hypothetical protein